MSPFKSLTLATLLFPFTLGAVTIAEKKASLNVYEKECDPLTESQLGEVNTQIAEKRMLLESLYRQIYERYAQGEEMDEIIAQIGQVREEIFTIEQMWQREASSRFTPESYALWHQPNTTLLQLVMDYGAQDYIYLVPPEISQIPLSISSSLPVPRESWGECLELILRTNGIGIRDLNAYLRELYLFNYEPGTITTITADPKQLETLSGNTRICYVLTPEAPDPRSILRFLERFTSNQQVSMDILGGEIFITAAVDSIKEILKLYDFIKEGGRSQDFKLVTLSKLDAGEMESILRSAFFIQGGDDTQLRIIPLQNVSHSLFLAGSREEIQKAMKLIRDIESQILSPKEKTVFWYTTKHSDAEELATVLAKIYHMLTEIPTTNGKADFSSIEKIAQEAKKEQLAVNPQKVIAAAAVARKVHRSSDGKNNFIVDPKTGSIIMVVEQEALPKIKELLKKLDVPKKMVQIEVLLFEKKVSNQSKFGLNLLRLGSQATGTVANALSWTSPGGKGIIEFLFSRGKGSGIPAYDLAYNFMLGQEDVQINASPSITTVNQTPATIAIVDEMSIYNGVDKDKKETYTRTQYGITIQITPTINMGDDEETDEAFITLDTDITFDSPQRGAGGDRPVVPRRQIKNHVRIADGQTVILGGLRRKTTDDKKDSIPFLGEIPGLGKLFSLTEMTDSSTEMFVFITPKIIADPIVDAEKIRREQLTKRPGDVPEYLHELLAAKEKQKQRLFSGSLSALFGREDQVTQTTRGRPEEYDGR